MVGIILLEKFSINHKREMEIQAAIEAKHGQKSDLANKSHIP